MNYIFYSVVTLSETDTVIFRFLKIILLDNNNSSIKSQVIVYY